MVIQIFSSCCFLDIAFNNNREKQKILMSFFFFFLFLADAWMLLLLEPICKSALPLLSSTGCLKKTAGFTPPTGRITTPTLCQLCCAIPPPHATHPHANSCISCSCDRKWTGAHGSSSGCEWKWVGSPRGTCFPWSRCWSPWTGHQEACKRLL